MPEKTKKTGFRGPHPDVGKAYRWKKGQSGNPGGRPKHDYAAELARAIIEGNPEAAYKGLLAQLGKGNAKVFVALAERGYGKLPQAIEHAGSEGGAIELVIKHIGTRITTETI